MLSIQGLSFASRTAGDGPQPVGVQQLPNIGNRETLSVYNEQTLPSGNGSYYRVILISQKGHLLLGFLIKLSIFFA